MNKLTTPFSFHAGVPALTTGMKDFQRSLAANGHAIFAKGADNAGIVYEAQEFAKQYPNPHHALVFRFTTFEFLGGNTDVPNYGSDPEAHARAYWDEVERRWPRELDPSLVFAEFPNEVDKNKSEWMGQLLYYAGLEAIRRGKKYCGPAWSAGEPEPGDWLHFRKYFELCEQYPDRLAVSVHEYTLDNTKELLETTPWLIGRVKFLNDACHEMGITPPKVFITEGGWGANDVPDVSHGVPQLIEALKFYIEVHPNVGGFALWALDSGWQWGSLAKQCVQYVVPMEQAIQATSWPEKHPQTPPPPEETLPKIVILKIPQEYTAEQAESVFASYWTPFKRTATASHDDMLTMLDPDVANDESYAIIIDYWLPSQRDAVIYLEEMGYNYQLVEWTQRPSENNPLENLSLGRLFDYQYIRTSSFNDQRDYGLHEGVDFDIIGGTADNKADVLCMYDGVVDRVATTSGYGNQVRVKSVNNGGTFYHRYAHLDAIYVQVGQPIAREQAVGEVGNTGNSFGEHIHINLEVPGHGLSGYTVRDVVDPWPYCYKGGYNLPPYAPAKTYDVFSYVMPQGTDYGQMIEVRHPSGATETFQMQKVPGSSPIEFYLVKNSQWEQFFLMAEGGTQYIWRGLDTSPGPAPSYAEKPGVLRLYKQFESGKRAARWCKRYMAIGEKFAGPGHLVQFYYKTPGCPESAANSGGATNVISLVKHYNAIEFNGMVVEDVIELSNGNEHWFYAKNVGMVAWTMDNPVGQSAIVEWLHGRDNLIREKVC